MYTAFMQNLKVGIETGTFGIKGEYVGTALKAI